MNVASLELCKELYELSGWRDTDYYFMNGYPVHKYAQSPGVDYSHLVPAYDLGYLLRKLPKRYGVGRRYENPEWFAEVGAVTTVADTPEDAAAKLAIELFKQGVLK